MHADPHAGNLLLHPDGGLVLLDFGQCKALSAPRLVRMRCFPLVSYGSCSRHHPQSTRPSLLNDIWDWICQTSRILLLFA